MDNIYFQIFLGLNLFLLGVVVTVAIRHAIAHFRPTHPDGRKHAPVQLSPLVKAKLLQEAEVQYRTILDEAAHELRRDLKHTTADLSGQMEKLGHEIVDAEMKRYRDSLEELRAHTELTIGNAVSSIETHQQDIEAKLAARQAELEAKMNADIEAEKQRLIAQIDTKLADAAASFLIETLQHNVDLGAQTAYLTSVLEEHKDDFKREVGAGNEPPASK